MLSSGLALVGGVIRTTRLQQIDWCGGSFHRRAVACGVYTRLCSLHGLYDFEHLQLQSDSLQPANLVNDFNTDSSPSVLQ
ncbi:hypothetical protein V6N13_029116 [Hibiscus sabdariffa]|uniref:Uncharacterized protein n=1 Tax=Hibiscus sabdariffa TaxID=183260 RepID=A0ABR2AD02_9ROSI